MGAPPRVALLAGALIISCGHGAVPSDIWIGGLYPLTGRLASGGVQRARSAELAVAAINADPTILPNTTLHLLVKDTQTSEPEGLVKAYEMIIRAEPAVAILGAASSGVSASVSLVTGIFQTPLISYSSTAASLSNKEQFPFFARVVTPDNVQARAVSEMVTYLGWRKFAILCSDDTYGTGLAQQVGLDLTELGAEVLTISKFPPNGNPAVHLEALRNLDARIIILCAVVGDARRVFLAASELGMVGPPYQYVGMDGWSTEQLWLNDGMEFSAAELAAVREAAIGAIATGPSSAFKHEQPFVEFQTQVWDVDSVVLANGWNGTALNSYTPYSWDCTWVVAQAIHKLCETAGDNCASAVQDGTQVLSTLLASEYQGVTGDVIFTETADRAGSFESLNLGPSGTWTVFGNWDEIEGFSQSTRNVHWPGGGEQLPDSPSSGGESAGKDEGEGETKVVIVQNAEAFPLVLVLVLSTVLGAMVLTALCYGLWLFARRFLSIQKAAAAQQHAKHHRIDAAIKGVTTCGFNVCFVKFKHFKQYGALISHEQVRERGHLVGLDTYEDVLAFVEQHPTMFISHQWLGYREPDPRNEHYPCICAATRCVAASFGIAENDLYLWIDYVSIPQRNTTLKSLSIQSLGVYASVARFFVVIAPTCTHADSGQQCDAETYQRRGWCRLEQWARMTYGGLTNMYIYTGPGGAVLLDESSGCEAESTEGVGDTVSARDNAEARSAAPPTVVAQPAAEDHSLARPPHLVPIKDKPKWYKGSIAVFEGEFTHEQDRWKLVDTVLGLWLVQENKDKVFPAEYFEDLIGLVEARVNDFASDNKLMAELDNRNAERFLAADTESQRTRGTGTPRSGRADISSLGIAMVVTNTVRKSMRPSKKGLGVEVDKDKDKDKDVLSEASPTPPAFMPPAPTRAADVPACAKAAGLSHTSDAADSCISHVPLVSSWMNVEDVHEDGSSRRARRRSDMDARNASLRTTGHLWRGASRGSGVAPGAGGEGSPAGDMAILSNAARETYRGVKSMRREVEGRNSERHVDRIVPISGQP